MAGCFFASDLHGDSARYDRLFDAIRRETPEAVFLGGDLLPGGFGIAGTSQDQFLEETLVSGFGSIRASLGARAPRVFVILGNDDLRAVEPLVRDAETGGIWEYAHGRRLALGPHPVYGYACVPPTPFRVKDWERYDVSRFVDPGCVSPEEGQRSVPVDPSDARHGTIRRDLERLTDGDDLEQAIFLFHAPPHDTALDRAALEGVQVDHAPLDVHVGSIAVRRFIDERQPRVTLHGHVHESARLTGRWRIRLGRTHCFSAAHDGPELALVRFDPARPEDAARELIAAG